MKRSRSAAFVVVFAVLLTQYQNCGDMGGPGISGLPSKGCDEGDCTDSSFGDVSAMKIAITSAKSLGSGPSELIVPVQESAINVSGTCSNGGFKNTKIDWVLKQGTIEKLRGRAQGCAEVGEFTLSAPVTAGTLVSGTNLSFEATIVAFDQYDNEKAGSTSTITVRPLAFLISPILDTRACPEFSNGQNWRTTLENFVYPLTTTETFLILGEVTPALCGYCQIRANEAGKPIDLKLTPVALPPGVTPVPVKNLDIARCTPLAAALPAGLNPAYNGRFVRNPGNGIPVNYDGNADPNNQTFGAWHARLSVGVTDTVATETYESIPSQSIEVHFKFQPNNGEAGRGWSVPVARSVLRRLKSAVTFTAVPDGMTLNGEARALYGTLKKATSTAARPLRTAVITNYMKATEDIEPVTNVVNGVSTTVQEVVLKNMSINMAGSFSKLMIDVAEGIRPCDTTITQNMNNRIPDFKFPYPDGSGGEIQVDPVGRDAQMTRVAVCMVYWFSRGFLGRNGGNLPDALKEGFKFNRDAATKCRTFVSNKSVEFCDFMVRYFEHADLMASRYLRPGNKITDRSNQVNIEKWYAAMAQFFIDWMMGSDMCDFSVVPRNGVRAANEFWTNVFRSVLTVDTTKDMSGLTGVIVQEENGFPAAFAAYGSAGGEVCGSGLAYGSSRLPPTPQ